MITGFRKNDMVAELNVRSHTIVSGLAEKLGGHDEGMNPHELLEAALTACTILTAQMYANRKGYKLESTNVVVKIVSEGKDTQISREVSYTGDLTEEEKNKISTIVEMCPIHKLLESNVKITTTIVK